MNPQLLAMPCPSCSSHVLPLRASGYVVVWYCCHDCGAEWSAQLCNGRLDEVTVTVQGARTA